MAVRAVAVRPRVTSATCAAPRPKATTRITLAAAIIACLSARVAAKRKANAVAGASNSRYNLII